MLQIATARIVIKYFISQFSDVIVRSSTVEQWQCGSHLTYSTAERSAFQFRLPLNTLRKEQGARSEEQGAEVSRLATASPSIGGHGDFVRWRKSISSFWVIHGASSVNLRPYFLAVR